ncbi:hypothetical protein H6P81_003058 [Aristolochia fimbriata]|uniref:Uncharacterized protein n=1 Tax=Aristolochia fimbriata TaxID=158543 RepID=A0AAV7FBI4_ARIFI|nr:hypothetical protein H6P81_003058 [Aristolochia fimbriata]
MNIHHRPSMRPRKQNVAKDNLPTSFLQILSKLNQSHGSSTRERVGKSSLAAPYFQCLHARPWMREIAMYPSCTRPNTYDEYPYNISKGQKKRRIKGRERGKKEQMGKGGDGYFIPLSVENYVLDSCSLFLSTLAEEPDAHKKTIKRKGRGDKIKPEAASKEGTARSVLETRRQCPFVFAFCP